MLALGGALLLALAGRPAAAQTAATPDTLPHLLYQDALQAITEGRNGDASETLLQVIDQEPLHAGAWLDLALIQCGLGHGAEAERLFGAIETRFDPPPGIMERINQARAFGCDGWQRHVRHGVALARGIDQNVNQGPNNMLFQAGPAGALVELPLLPEFAPKHDQYSLLSLDYASDLTPNGALGFVQLQARRNDQLHQYDSAALLAGLEAPWRAGRWSGRGSALFGLVTLGGQLYQRLLQLQAQSTLPMTLPAGAQLGVSGVLTHVDYLTLSNFNSDTLELRSQLSWRGQGAYASAGLAYLDDHATAARPGGDRRGANLALLLRQRLAPALEGEFGYLRQNWQSQSIYAPGLIEQRRDQRNELWRASLTYALTKNQNLQLELRQVHNRENISIFQYNNRQLQLSWHWLGP